VNVFFDRKTTKLRTNKKLKRQLNRIKTKVIRNQINENKECFDLNANQKVLDLENESILGIIS
jgi:hypothetical protein